MRATNATDPRFELWLLRETGIDASSLGVNALERVRATQADSQPHPSDRSADATATHDATASVAVDVIDAYWQLLNASPDEQHALVEALVVPETWFFRDREASVALARLANERLVRKPAHFPLAFTFQRARPVDPTRCLAAPFGQAQAAHYEALTHLGVLLDVTGDSAGAQQLMRRAQRAAAQASKPQEEHANHLRGSHGSRRR